MKKLVITILGVMFIISAIAQSTVNIVGIVKMSDTDVIDEVTVNFFEKGIGYDIDIEVQPNEDGVYTYTFDLTTFLSSTVPAIFDITISKTGYETVTIENFTINTSGNKVLPTKVLISIGQEIYQPSICAINYINGINHIAWERHDEEGIARYIVYKANPTTQLYDSIGGLNFDEISVFEDSLPSTTGTDTYQIQAIFENGGSSDFSLESSSFFLTIRSDDFVQKITWLNFSDIAGFRSYEYDSVYVYRGTHLDSMQIIKGYAITENNILEVSQITDNLESNGVYYYQVGVSLVASCAPATVTLKSESGPFSQALSNIAELTIDVEETNITADYKKPKTLEVAVNKSSQTAKVITSENGQLIISDLSGRVVYNSSIKKGETEIKLEKGHYIFSFTSAKQKLSATIVIE